MPAARRPRLYLIDGYSDIFRAFYALPRFTNSKGMPTGAVYGFLNMLKKLLREERPELVGVAMDVAGATVRDEKFAEYKATRQPIPEDLEAQIPWVRKGLAALRIPVLELARYEADDVLGTLARRAVAEGYDVVLVSADKDLLQLVGEHVSMWHTRREKLYDRKAVEEDYGVPPEKMIDLLALIGDTVDNVSGVKGIGEQGARQLIQEFGSLEGLLEKAGEVRQTRYRNALLQHGEAGRISKELVTIHTDLPVPFEPDALRRDAPDLPALRELARELEFRSLVEGLEEGGQGAAQAGAAIAPAALEAVEPAEELTTAEAWTEAAETVTGAEIAVGMVGDGAGPIGLAFLAARGPVYADFRRPGLRQPALTILRAWLADPGRGLVGHDLKEVVRLAGPRPAPRCRLLDTMLHSYLLRPTGRHGLPDVALERLDYKALTPREAGWERGAEPGLGQVALRVFAAEQVVLPQRWAETMAAELVEQRLAEVYRTIEAPLIPVLVTMEERGILVDREALTEMSGELARRMAGLEEEIYRLAGQTFNLGSPQQLGEVLFERLGYPSGRRTKKKKSYSTDADTLQELAARGYEVAAKVLVHRELAKLKSTYVDALPGLVAADGRLHTRYLQAVAATGRLSSVNPNLQNIPIRSEEGKRIRRAFVAAPGTAMLVADYNQVELRVLAHIAEEPALVEAFARGEDIHRATAAAVFNVLPELVTPDQRRAAKVINFGIMYGMSAFGLAQNLGIERPQAQAFIDAYLVRYAGVKRYMEETLAGAERNGRVETLFGRARWLPELTSRNYMLRENAKRMAINARIQGTAADLLKKAMIAVDRRLAEEHPEAHLLLTVHDELVLEAPLAEVAAVEELVRREMESVAELRVPLVVDTGSGPSWYEAKGGA